MANFHQLSILAFALIFLIFAPNTNAEPDPCPKPDRVIFCYYSSWAIYREGFGNYNATRIDPNLCTHMVYAFAGLDLHGYTISLDAFNDLPEAAGAHQFQTFRELREQNSCLKIMLSIGGWGEGSEKFSIMAETEDSRRNFIEHLLRFLVYYGFDGVDIDWEYPTQRGGIVADKENFVSLLSELKGRLKSRNKQVAIAVGAANQVIAEGYNVTKISAIVDYVLLMAYDYHRPDVTSHVAPLNEMAGDNTGSVHLSTQKWLSEGCPKDKLVLGVLSSGRTYTLNSTTQNGLGAKVKGPGNAGRYTKSPGFISYYEVCDVLLAQTWDEVKNTTYGNNYAYRGDQWMTYETPETIEQKAKYAKDNNLAGVMLWSIDTDDFYPLCNKTEKYPLHKAIRRGLGLP